MCGAGYANQLKKVKRWIDDDEAAAAVRIRCLLSGGDERKWEATSKPQKRVFSSLIAPR
jgi:hypothetical protein